MVFLDISCRKAAFTSSYFIF